MKKLVLTFSALLLAAGLSFAQSMSEATEAAKAANEAITAENYDAALEGFQKALGIAEKCGDEGAELVGQCKGVIPKLALSAAKAQAKAQNFDNAIEGLKKAIALGTEFGGAEEVIAEAQGLIPDIYLSQGNDNLRNQKFAEAIAAYKSVLEIKPDYAKAALLIGQAYSQAGDTKNAIAAFKEAGKFEENAATVAKMLANLNLKQANASYQAGKLADAVELALDCFNGENATDQIKNSAASIIAGCTQKAAMANNFSSAASFYNKLADVDAKNSKLGSLAYTIGACYYKANNKASAKEWLRKALNDPKVGANAKQLFDSIK